MDLILTVILLSFAGPIIGSIIGVLHKPSERFMFGMLAFAAGVMLSVAFLQLLPQSLKISGAITAMLGLAAGALVMYVLDKVIPHIHPGLCSQEQGKSFEKTAFYLFLGIFLHNFPEGMAIGMGSLAGIKESLTIAIAIAIHDIPEGVCTSAPFYFATGERLKSFLISTSTAIPTLIGFAFAYFFLQGAPSFISSFLTAATAGIMIYISTDELIPNAFSKTSDHSTIFALVAGVLFVIMLGLL